MRSDIATLVEIQLTAGTVYYSTHEGMVDASGNVYSRRLQSHPVINKELSDLFYGFIVISNVRVNLENLDDALSDLFRVEVRNTRCILRKYNTVTSTYSQSFTGIINSREFASPGIIRLDICECGTDVTSSEYPKHSVTASSFGTINQTVDRDVGLTVPYIAGSSREHTPCRFVEANNAQDRFRYIVAGDASPSSDSLPILRPYPNAIYLGTSAGPVVSPFGEYNIEWPDALDAPSPPIITSEAGSGSLTSAVGDTLWVLTKTNAFGETTESSSTSNAETLSSSAVTLTWSLGESLDAGGYKLYRNNSDGSAVWGLVKDFTDINEFKITNDENETIISYEDDGTTRDTDVTPPASNTTRSGTLDVIFPFPAYGQSSQLVEVLADVEHTEIGVRDDTLGLWLFRDKEVRDIAGGKKNVFINERVAHCWDFLETPTVAGTDQLLDRVGSIDFDIGSSMTPTYSTGRFSNGIIDGIFRAHSGALDGGFIKDNDSGQLELNYSSSVAFRIDAMVRPRTNTADRAMPIFNYGVSNGFRFGINGGKLTGDIGGTENDIWHQGNRVLDGAWHKVTMLVEREGTINGAAGDDPPSVVQVDSHTDTTTTNLAFSVDYSDYDSENAASAQLVIVIHSEDGGDDGTPDSVTFEGTSLNKIIQQESHTSSTRSTESIWELKDPDIGGIKNVAVTFATTQTDAQAVVLLLNNVLDTGGDQWEASASFGNASDGDTSTTIVPLTDYGIIVDAYGTIGTGAPSTTHDGDGTYTSQYNQAVSSTRMKVGTYIVQTGDTDSSLTITHDGGSSEAAQCTVQFAASATADPIPATRDRLAFYVDGIQDGIDMKIGVGDVNEAGSIQDLTASGDVEIGTTQRGGATVPEVESSYWEGEIEWITISEESDSGVLGEPFSFVAGKSNSALSAIDCTDATDNPSPFISLEQQNQNGQHYSVGSGDFTVEAWVKLASLKSNAHVIAVGTPPNKSYQLIMNSGKPKLTFDDSNSNSSSFESTATALSLDEWHYVAAVVKRETASVDGTITFFIDGDSGESTTISARTPGECIGIPRIIIGNSDKDATDKLDGYIDELHIFTGLRTEEEARHIYYLGLQNTAYQIKQFMEAGIHGPGQTTDSTTFNDCATELATNVGDGTENQFKSAYAMVEKAALREHVAELLRLRGMKMDMDESGVWTLSCDVEDAASFSFGYNDGFWNNITQRPFWKQTALDNASKTMKINYRPKRNASGSIDKFALTTSERDVLPVGLAETFETNIPALRDRRSADIYADYFSKRLKYSDNIVTFIADDDADSLALRSLMTVYDPQAGVDSGVYEVRSIVDRGLQYTITAHGWDSSIYSYEAGTLPNDPFPETGDDFEDAIPDPPTSVTLVSISEKEFVVTWTPPARNYAGAAILIRQVNASSGAPQADNFWTFGQVIEGVRIRRAQVTISLTAGNSYRAAVQSMSPARRFSTPAASVNWSAI